MPENIQTEAPEETYTRSHLALIDALPEKINLGWIKQPPNESYWHYADHVLTVPETSPPTVQDVSEDGLNLQLTVPVPGMPTTYTRFKTTGPTLDQAFTPQCVTHSGSYIRTQEERKEHHRTYLTDPHEWYARCKEQDGIPNADGTYIPIAAGIAKNRGVIMIDRETGKVQPSPQKIASYLQITSVEQIVEALWKVGPVWFGIEVDKGIFSPLKTSDGRFILPPPSGNPVGGHAMCATGYNWNHGWIEVHQTWGSDYADHGKFYMPITWFTKYSDWDAWTCVNLKQSISV